MKVVGVNRLRVCVFLRPGRSVLKFVGVERLRVYGVKIATQADRQARAAALAAAHAFL
jgi:hypothetical protein